jgi:hypothetical protein
MTQNRAEGDSLIHVVKDHQKSYILVLWNLALGERDGRRAVFDRFVSFLGALFDYSRNGQGIVDSGHLYGHN